MNGLYPGWQGVCSGDVPEAELMPADDADFIVIVAGGLPAGCVEWPELAALAMQMDEAAAAELLESLEVQS